MYLNLKRTISKPICIYSVFFSHFTVIHVWYFRMLSFNNKYLNPQPLSLMPSTINLRCKLMLLMQVESRVKVFYS